MRLIKSTKKNGQDAQFRGGVYLEFVHTDENKKLAFFILNFILNYIKIIVVWSEIILYIRLTYYKVLSKQTNKNFFMKGRQKMKKLLILMLTVVMILSFGIIASATEAEGTTTVTTEEELARALTNGGNITLGDDIFVNTMITVPSGVTATLDLNGYAITSGYQAGSTAKHIYPINNNGDLTLKDSIGTGSITGGTFTAHFDNVSPVELSAGAEITGGVYQNHSGEASTHSYVTKYIKEGYELSEDGTVASSYAVVVNGTGYETIADAIAAAKALTGDVVVEIYDKVTLNVNLDGSYDKLTFVGKTATAEIYLEVQGYITATGKSVAFENLILSKSAGGHITNAGFMNVAFGVYQVNEVVYTNCTFANGACASSGNVTYTKCTFYRSHDKYGLWAYGDVTVTVDSCGFDDYRGIKMYSEGAQKTTELTVKNTDFSALTGKPAIVLTDGESVTLAGGNTYSSTGTFELDLDGVPNGTAITVAEGETVTCRNDNGACGVIVDGKIYTTVAQAAEVAASGSTVTLLHNTTEVVELPEGTTLVTNGYTAENVTIEKVIVVTLSDGYTKEFTSLASAISFSYSAGSKVSITVYKDITEEMSALYGNIISGNENGVTITNTYTGWVYVDEALTLGAGVTYSAEAIFVTDAEAKIYGNIQTENLYVADDSTVSIYAPATVVVDGSTHVRRNDNINSGIYVYGDNDDTTVEYKSTYYTGVYSGTFYAKDATVEMGYALFNNSNDASYDATLSLVLDNSSITIIGTTDTQDSFIIDGTTSVSLSNGSSIEDVRDFSIKAGTSLTLSVDETSTISATNMSIAEDVPFVAEKNEDGTHTVKKVYIEVTYADGTVEYFDDILEAVPYKTNYPKLEGAYIKLLADYAGPGIRLMENGMVFDLNGFTYTISAGTGSQGTTTQGFQIRPEVTESVTIKGGNIAVAPGTQIVWMFNSYASNLVIENVTVDCTNMAYDTYGSSVYVLVVQASDDVVELKGTTIKSFDSSKAGEAIVSAGSISLDENTTVDGTIMLDPGATLVAKEGLTVVTADGYSIVYKDGKYTSVEVSYVAQIGENKFETVADALAYAKEQGIVDLVITIIGENTKETPEKFDLMYVAVFDSVIVKQADNSKAFYFNRLYTGERTNGGTFVFDGVNFIVTEQYMFEGNVKLINNSIVKSISESNCFLYYSTTTVEAGSMLAGVIDDFRGGDLIIDGGLTDGSFNVTPGLQDSILFIRWSGDSLTLKNGAYAKINAANEVGRVTVTAETTLNVYSSKLEAVQYITNDGTINIDVNSIIKTGEITGTGIINVDITGLTGSALVIDADMSGFTGKINIIGTGDATYEITEQGLVVNKVEKTELDDIFTYLGVSAKMDGTGITVGFEFDNEAYALYVEQNGELDFGTHFAIAGYGAVEQSLVDYASNAGQFNVIVNNVTEAHASYKLEMALYVGSGDSKQYVTANGIESAITVTYDAIPANYKEEEVNA